MILLQVVQTHLKFLSDLDLLHWDQCTEIKHLSKNTVQIPIQQNIILKLFHYALKRCALIIYTTIPNLLK